MEAGFMSCRDERETAGAWRVDGTLCGAISLEAGP